MSTSTTTENAATDHEPPTAKEELEAHAHDHPSDGDYVKIALILGVITALEVGTYFWKDLFGSEPSTFALIATLFPMMIAKFLIVIGYFMHLKYDNPIFKRVFTFGLLLALAVFAAALTAFEFWDDRFLRFLTG